MQPKHRKHCSAPLHPETGDSLYCPSSGTLPVKSSTFWSRHSPLLKVMNDAESIPIPTTALGSGVSHHWWLHMLRDQVMEKLVAVLHAWGYRRGPWPWVSCAEAGNPKRPWLWATHANSVAMDEPWQNGDNKKHHYTQPWFITHCLTKGLRQSECNLEWKHGKIRLGRNEDKHLT